MTRKSQTTSLTERSNVNFHMWRKKVDNTIFRNKGTTIPIWLVRVWDLEKHFPDNSGTTSKKQLEAEANIIFQKKKYTGHLTCTSPKNRKNKVHRLWFPEELVDQLKNVFLMSHMRDIESDLRGDVGDIEKEIPFWEFVDIEFNPIVKEFILTAHYKQEPIFPQLFGNLAGSPALKNIEDEVKGKVDFRIHKQDWKERNKLNTEIGAVNAIYTLIDTKNKFIYVGEAKNLIKRLRQKYPTIPNWTHYRYDTLPKNTPDKTRVAIERMIIRSHACLFKNKADVDSLNLSEYKLANDKIDR